MAVSVSSTGTATFTVGTANVIINMARVPMNLWQSTADALFAMTNSPGSADGYARRGIQTLNISFDDVVSVGTRVVFGKTDPAVDAGGSLGIRITSPGPLGYMGVGNDEKYYLETAAHEIGHAANAGLVNHSLMSSAPNYGGEILFGALTISRYLASGQGLPLDETNALRAEIFFFLKNGNNGSSATLQQIDQLGLRSLIDVESGQQANGQFRLKDESSFEAALPAYVANAVDHYQNDTGSIFGLVDRYRYLNTRQQKDAPDVEEPGDVAITDTGVVIETDVVVDINGSIQSSTTVTVQNSTTSSQPTTTITGSAIGSIFGSSIGQALAGQNAFTRVAAGSMLSTALSSVGGAFDLYFNDTTGNLSLEGAVATSLNSLGANLGSTLASQATSALSGYLVGEFYKMLGVNTSSTGGQLLTIASNTVVNQLISNITHGAALSTGFNGTMITNMAGAIGGSSTLRADNDNAQMEIAA
jgi:hypothetical protein